MGCPGGNIGWPHFLAKARDPGERSRMWGSSSLFPSHIRLPLLPRIPAFKCRARSEYTAWSADNSYNAKDMWNNKLTTWSVVCICICLFASFFFFFFFLGLVFIHICLIFWKSPLLTHHNCKRSGSYWCLFDSWKHKSRFWCSALFWYLTDVLETEVQCRVGWKNEVDICYPWNCTSWMMNLFDHFLNVIFFFFLRHHPLKVFRFSKLNNPEVLHQILVFKWRESLLRIAPRVASHYGCVYRHGFLLR